MMMGMTKKMHFDTSLNDLEFYLRLQHFEKTRIFVVFLLFSDIISTKTEHDYLNGRIKQWSHAQISHPKL